MMRPALMLWEYGCGGGNGGGGDGGEDSVLCQYEENLC